MLKSVNKWCFPGHVDTITAMREAKKAGFEAIEPAFGPSEDITPENYTQRAPEIRREAEALGIKILSLASSTYSRSSLTSNDEDERNFSLESMEHHMRCAKLLGCDKILVVAGAVNDDVSYDVAYERALDAFKHIKEMAERHEVHALIENVWNKFLLSPLEFRDFIDKVDSPYVGAYLDVGNMVLYGYPWHWIKILNKRIGLVHVKDFRRAAGTSVGFVGLLEGDVNYRRTIAALREIGYEGPLIGEVGAYAGDDFASIYQTSKALDIILSY